MSLDDQVKGSKILRIRWNSLSGAADLETSRTGEPHL